jgi:hypothetical protein
VTRDSAFHFSVFCFRIKGMDNPSPDSVPLAAPDRLALARQAFARFHTRCFWFMREDLQIGEAEIETIIRGLRAHGNRQAFLIAAKLCR